jgi:hypothetical protein
MAEFGVLEPPLRLSVLNRGATPFGHPTPEAAIALIKQMIDSPSATIKAPKTIQ